MNMADQVKGSQPSTWVQGNFLKLTERWWINFATLLKQQIPEVNPEEPHGHPSRTAGRRREKFRWCLADQCQDKFPQLPQEEPREMNYLPVEVCVRVKKKKIKMLFNKVWLDMEEATLILTGFLNDSGRQQADAVFWLVMGKLF